MQKADRIFLEGDPLLSNVVRITVNLSSDLHSVYFGGIICIK